MRSALSLAQLRLQRAPLVGRIERRIVVGERTRALDMQRCEHRPCEPDDMSDLLLERGELTEVERVRIAGRAREARKISFLVRDRMTAVRLVGAVVTNKMYEILGRRCPDGHEAAEVHEQAA